MALGAQMGLTVLVSPQFNQQAWNSAAVTQGKLLAKNIQSAMARAPQPLGRITGAVSEFEKSMAAANARVLAFGASAGGIYLIHDAFKKIASSTVMVEKALADINVVLGLGQTALKQFSNEMFKAASNTGQTFETASKVALEFARHGVSATETAKRMTSAMQLMRISGLNAQQSVNAITAAINAFNREGLTSEDIVNRMTAVDTKFAVSAQDLAKAIERVGSTAVDAGVKFNQLLAMVTAIQTATSRGGAVIGNALKSIFTRVSRPEVLADLENMGIATRNAQGQVEPMITVLKRLSSQYDSLNFAQKSFIAEAVGGVYQINILKALMADMGRSISIFDRATMTAAMSTGLIERRMAMLNETISSKLNVSTANLTRLFSSFGQVGFGTGTKKGLDFFNDQIESIADTLQDFSEDDSFGEKMGKSLAQGLVKGMGDILSGPGMQLITALLTRISSQFVVFAVQSGREYLGLNEAGKRQAAIQQSINSFLSSNQTLVQQWVRGQLSLNTLTSAYLSNLKAANIIYGQISNASKGATALTGGAVSVHGHTPATGYIPNFNADSYILEKQLAAAHGYRAGAVVPTTLYDGRGGAHRSVVNQAEQVIQTRNAQGYRATFVVPPNGFGQDTLRAGAGFIPNFAAMRNREMLGFGAYGSVFPMQIRKQPVPLVAKYFRSGQEYADEEYELARMLDKARESGSIHPLFHLPKTIRKIGQVLVKERVEGKDVGGTVIPRYGQRDDESNARRALGWEILQPFQKLFGRQLVPHGLAPDDFVGHSGNTMLNSKAQKIFNKIISSPKAIKFAGSLHNPQTLERVATAIYRQGGRMAVVDPGLFQKVRPGEQDYWHRTFGGQDSEPTRTLASGFIPNFKKTRGKYKFPKMSMAAMEANIGSSFDKLAPADQRYFARAYEDYHNLITRFSESSGVSKDDFANVFSALSPSNPLERNALDALRYVLAGKKIAGGLNESADIEGAIKSIAKIPAITYRDNRRKAARIFMGTETITGNKRKAFVNDMLDPFSSPDVTVDYRAQSIASGRAYTANNAPTMSDADYAKLSTAFRNVGARSGVSGLGVQAATWVGNRGGTRAARGQSYNRGILKFLYENPSAITLENLNYFLQENSTAKSRKALRQQLQSKGIMPLAENSLITIARGIGFIPNFAAMHKREPLSGETDEEIRASHAKAKLAWSIIAPLQKIVGRQLVPQGVLATDFVGHPYNTMINPTMQNILQQIINSPNASKLAQKLGNNDNAERIAAAIARRGGRMSVVDPGSFSAISPGFENYWLKSFGGQPNPDFKAGSPLIAAGFVPNFSVSPLAQALMREGTPTAAVGFSAALKNPANPLGAGVYDRAYQSSLSVAMQQHRALGETSLQKAGAATGVVPNFDLSTSLMLGGLQGLIGNLSGKLNSLNFGYDRHLERLNRANQQYQVNLDLLRQGASVSVHGKTIDPNSGGTLNIGRAIRELRAEMRASAPAGFSTLGSVQAAQSAIYQPYHAAMMNRQQRISQAGTYAMLGGPVALQTGASLAKGFGAMDVGAGLETLSTAVMTSGQLLSALPTKLGVALAGGTMMKGFSDTISMTVSKLASPGKLLDIASTKLEKITTAGNSVMESFESLHNASRDATTSMSEYQSLITRHNRVLSELAAAAPAGQGHSLVSRVVSAGSEHERRGIIMEAIDAQTRAKNLASVKYTMASLQQDDALFGINPNVKFGGGLFAANRSLLGGENKLDALKKKAARQETAQSFIQSAFIDVGMDVQKRMVNQSMTAQDVSAFKSQIQKSPDFQDIDPTTAADVMNQILYELSKFQAPLGVSAEAWEAHLTKLNELKVKENSLRMRYNAELQATLSKGGIISGFALGRKGASLDKAYGEFEVSAQRYAQEGRLKNLYTAEGAMASYESEGKRRGIRARTQYESDKGSLEMMGGMNESLTKAVSSVMLPQAHASKVGDQTALTNILPPKAAQIDYLAERQKKLMENSPAAMKALSSGNTDAFIKMFLGDRSTVIESGKLQGPTYDTLSNTIKIALAGHRDAIGNHLIQQSRINQNGFNELIKVNNEEAAAIKEARFKELAAGIKGIDELSRGGARKLRRELRRDEYVMAHSRSAIRRGEAARDLLNYIPSDQRDANNPYIKNLYDTSIAGSQTAWDMVFRGSNLGRNAAINTGEMADARILGNHKGVNLDKVYGKRLPSLENAAFSGSIPMPKLDVSGMQNSVNAAEQAINRFSKSLDNIGKNLPQLFEEMKAVNADILNEAKRYANQQKESGPGPGAATGSSLTTLGALGSQYGTTLALLAGMFLTRGRGRLSLGIGKRPSAPARLPANTPSVAAGGANEINTAPAVAGAGPTVLGTRNAPSIASSTASAANATKTTGLGLGGGTPPSWATPHYTYRGAMQQAAKLLKAPVSTAQSWDDIINAAKSGKLRIDQAGMTPEEAAHIRKILAKIKDGGGRSSPSNIRYQLAQLGITPENTNFGMPMPAKGARNTANFVVEPLKLYPAQAGRTVEFNSPMSQWPEGFRPLNPTMSKGVNWSAIGGRIGGAFRPHNTLNQMNPLSGWGAAGTGAKFLRGLGAVGMVAGGASAIKDLAHGDTDAGLKGAAGLLAGTIAPIPTTAVLGGLAAYEQVKNKEMAIQDLKTTQFLSGMSNRAATNPEVQKNLSSILNKGWGANTQDKEWLARYGKIRGVDMSGAFQNRISEQASSLLGSKRQEILGNLVASSGMKEIDGEKWGIMGYGSNQRWSRLTTSQKKLDAMNPDMRRIVEQSDQNRMREFEMRQKNLDSYRESAEGKRIANARRGEARQMAANAVAKDLEAQGLKEQAAQVRQNAPAVLQAQQNTEVLLKLADGIKMLTTVLSVTKPEKEDSVMGGLVEQLRVAAAAMQQAAGALQSKAGLPPVVQQTP